MKYLLSMLAAGTAIVNSLAEGWNQRTGAVVLNPGVEVVVSDSDAASVANSTSITFREGASLVFTNMTSTIFLNGNFINETSKALVRITGSKPVVINADNSGWTGTNVLEGTSILIVSNRYGLGTSATPMVAVTNNTANLWFGGNGLTNDVPIYISQGMKGRQMQHNRAFGPFVQNGAFTDDMDTKYGDAIINGTYYCRSSSGPKVDAGRHFHINGPWSWGGWFMVGGAGTLHINHQATANVGNFYYTGYLNSPFTVVFGVTDAFRGIPFWNLCAGLTVDLNGFDQRCTYMTKPNNYDKSIPLTIKSSSGPATLTMSESAATEYSRPARFEGPVSLIYSRTGKQIFTTWKSTATGELKVTSGTLEFASGAGWGGDVINLTGGKLLLSATDPLTSSNAVVTVNGGTLEIAAGVTAAMRKLVCGDKTLKIPGLYAIADLTIEGYTGLAGTGSIFIPDVRPVFSAALDPTGDVTVTDVGDNTVVDDGKVVIPYGEELSLTWAASALPSTRFEFKAEVASGSLKVYQGEELVATITASGTYDIAGSAALSLRFVSEGDGVKIHAFTNQAKIMIAADDNGLVVEGGVIGVNTVPVGGTLVLVIRRVYDSAMPTTGVIVNGVAYAFDDYPNGIPVSLSDANRGGDITVSAVYASSITAWYVDCENGNDSWKGYFPECPKKTAQTVLNGAASGATVYLLPGVYSNGTTRVGSEKTLTRIYVPAGVSLVGLGRKEEIVVLGQKAPIEKQVPNSDGCGEDAVRCIYMEDIDVVVRNLTVAGGRAYTDVVGGLATTDEEGAGIYIEKYGGYVVDCVISNCVANRAAAVRGLNYGSYIINSRICNNKALWHMVVCYSHLYGTVFDHNTGANPVLGADKSYDIVNCTFGPGNDNNGTQHVLRGKFKVYNSIVYGGMYSDWGTTFYRSYFADAYYPESIKTTPGKLNDGCKSHADDGIDIVLDGTITPVKGQCSSIDAGADYTSLYPAGYEDWAKVDLYGNPRVLNGAIDVGAVEYDWRPDFARDIYKDFECTGASPSVVENEGKVRLTNGAAVTLGWQQGPKVKSLLVPVTVSDGTLTIRKNGEVVATLTADTIWRYRGVQTSDVIEFSYSGSGYAELAIAKSGAGLVLVVR